MIALLASPWGAPTLAALGLLAVTAGVALGAGWDDLRATIRRHYAPGSHRR